MVGRGIFHNPWLFNPSIDQSEIPLHERLSLLRFHVELFDQTWGTRKNYNLLKKFFKIYLLGLSDTADLKDQLMSTSSPQECLAILAKPEIVSREAYRV